MADLLEKNCSLSFAMGHVLLSNARQINVCSLCSLTIMYLIIINYFYYHNHKTLLMNITHFRCDNKARFLTMEKGLIINENDRIEFILRCSSQCEHEWTSRLLNADGDPVPDLQNYLTGTYFYCLINNQERIYDFLGAILSTTLIIRICRSTIPRLLSHPSLSQS